jgi:hypothetical protein
MLNNKREILIRTVQQRTTFNNNFFTTLATKIHIDIIYERLKKKQHFLLFVGRLVGLERGGVAWNVSGELNPAESKRRNTVS